MAKLFEIDEDQLAWIDQRPPVIQAMIEKHPPNLLYRLKSTGHRCTLYSYGESGTVTVTITGEYNKIAFDRHVFGINPDELEECDLPAPDEEVGTLFTDEQDIEEYIDLIRSAVLAARRGVDS